MTTGKTVLCLNKIKYMTVTKSVKELIEDKSSPLPLEVIPNNMGINLSSVESLSWERQADGQIKYLTINFIPA